MRRILSSLALLAVLMPSAWAVEIKLPAEINGTPGQFVTIQADTQGKVVRWVSLDAGLNMFPSELLRDSRYAVVTAAANGRYRLLAYTAAGDEPSAPAVITVVISGGPNPPVPPIPPGPNPPNPPPDPPNPPSPPVDAFTQDIMRLYASDAAPERAMYRDQLAALYRQAAQTTVNDTRLSTAGELLATLKEASGKALPANALRFVRERIAEELNRSLPLKADAPLDASIRGNAALVFTRMSRALEACK